MALTLLGIISGAIIAIIITILVENQRKPKLELKIAPPIDKEYNKRPANNVRFLVLELLNKPLPWFARWMSRNAALQCHGTITFHHLNDGQNVFGRAMTTRWSGSPEPIPLQFIIEDKHYFIVDPTRLTLASKIDIYPNESGRVDVAAKFDKEEQCYGWSNENYFSDPVWRNYRWMLPAGRFLIKVNIYSAGERCSGIFRLINDVPQMDFRLEERMAQDDVRE
jgi:hypothetical protein